MSPRPAGETSVPDWIRSLGLDEGACLRVTDAGTLPAPTAGPFACLAVEGALEHTEWDRWLLQRLRARLVDGAPVLVRARNLASLASPGDGLELAGRTARELLRRLGVARPGPGDAFRGRRYTPARLSRLLEQTGYTVERIVGTRFGADWLALAHARPADPVTGHVACGTGPAAVAQFERDHAADLAARDRWLALHRPGGGAPAARALDAREYAGRAAVVLAPHPDDEVVGAAGTLLRLVRAGARVTCVLATDGASGHALRHAPEAARRTVRIAEARAVAGRAGFAELAAWELDEATFAPRADLAARLADLLVRQRPALVLTPFLTDRHPHHLAMSALLATALEDARVDGALADCTVLGYEVWGAAPADVVCDVTDLGREIEALLWTYESGMKVDDFVDLCTRRGVHHAQAYLGRTGLAEAFFACPARDYPALARASLHPLPTASV